MFERKPGLRLSNSKLIWRNYSKVALRVALLHWKNNQIKKEDKDDSGSKLDILLPIRLKPDI